MPEPFDPGVFRELAAAVRDRRRVVLSYWTASRDEETRRELDPYHLACIDGHWYLVAFCHLRGDVPHVCPVASPVAGATDTTFHMPEDFRIGEYLGRSFCVLRGAEGEVHRVRLRFVGEAVKYVRERTWHPSQVLEATDDGGLIVGFELGHLREVERWAMSWGPDCEVLEPPGLRLVAARATATSRLYRSGGRRHGTGQ